MDAKRDHKYDPINLALDAYDYGECYKEESDDLTVKDDLPPLEGNEGKVKEGKGLKISKW